jgi:hypothetical protein
MRGDERFDELIDGALRSYSEPGEVPETRVVVARVLDRARDEETARRRVWIWGWAVAAACLVVLLVVLGSTWRVRGPKTPEIAWTPQGPGLVKVVPQRLKPDVNLGRNGTAEAVPLQSKFVVQEVLKRAANEETAAERELPKLDVFPTPRPLTPQEEALVAFAQQGSPEVKKQVVEAQAHIGDPIAIAELEITPLRSGEKQDSGKDSNKER